MSFLIENDFDYDIVITSYNSKVSIERAITSATNQLIPAKKIIIVDDNSQDDSIEIIKHMQLAHASIELFINDMNRGQSFCRNLGVDLSTSKYVMFIDDDDLSMPERSLMHYRMFKDGANLCFVSSNKYYENGYSVSCQNNEVKVRKFDSAEMLLYLITGNSNKFDNKFFIPASTCAVEVECYKSIGGYDVSFRRLEDVDFAIRATEEKFFFSWTADFGVNRFFSQRIDKGRGVDSKFEIMILNKFRELIEDEEFKKIIMYAKLREIYFGRHFFKGIFFLISHPTSLKIIGKKIRILISRITHDLQRVK